MDNFANLAFAHAPSILDNKTWFSVIVPVYNESPDRLDGLFSSLARQFIAPGSVEVVVVVNNKPNDGTTKWKRAFQRNQELLAHPYFRDGYPISLAEAMPMYAIDLSSEGKCSPDSNVGLARHIGLKEVARRYRSMGRNGIVMHTDADCRFDDPQFALKVKRLFDDPRLVGVGGVDSLEIDSTDPEASALLEVLELYVLFQRYTKLKRTIERGMVKVAVDRLKTFGRCIIHRAEEGILVGNIPPISLGEDVVFGDALKDYASQKGGMFLSGHDLQRLGPTSALRLSDRTPNSIRARFLDHVENGQIRVEDVLRPGHSVMLTETYLEQLVRVVRGMPEGDKLLRFLFFESSLAHLRIK